MLVRLASIAGFFVILSVTLQAAERGPSTVDERKQMIENIHAWQTNPLGPQAKDEFGSVLKFFADVPDLTVHVCTILDKLPKGEKKDASVVFGGEFMGQAAFVLENAGKPVDRDAEIQAGVEGALQTYEMLLKANPKDRQPYLDDLVQRRESGTLAQFVHQRSTEACH